MYVADPVLSDSSGQGGGFAGGRRIERVTYVFGSSGRYTLPAVELKWLDPQTQKPATVRAPALTVQVKSAAHAGARIAPELPVGAAPAAPRKPINWLQVAGWVLALVLIAAAALAARWLWPRWRERRAALEATHAQSDDVMFKHAIAACQANDARRAYQALLAWSQAHTQTTPQQWATQLGDAALARQLEGLQRFLFRSPGAAEATWQGAPCAAALGEARQRWRARDLAQRPGRAWGRSLGPLNPFGSES